MKRNVMNEKTLWNAKGGKTVQACEPAGLGQVVQRALMSAGGIVCTALLMGAMVTPLCAQPYPNKPLRYIIGMATGGTQDILGRIIAQKLAERLGQPVLPENRGGSGGNVGYEVAAKSKPDGYTILQCSTSLAISPGLYKKLNYDPIKDFAPISLVAETSYVVVVRPSLPVKSLKELVEYARANPGKLNYGSSGLGSAAQLSNELFKSLAKVNIVNVQYKGAGQMLVGLMSGEVDMLVIGPGVSLPLIQAGKVRALAVLSKERMPSLPNVPTAKEAGIDNWEVTGWHGILAPAGTPRDIISRLNAEWVKIAATPGGRELQHAEFEPLSSTPEQFSEHLKAEIARWGKVIKEANISLD